jgi:signal transduction histidine kinase
VNDASPVPAGNPDTAKLQAEIAKLKEELQETQKNTTRYLQNVAHQLTAPLNAIKWNIEAIKDERIPIPRKIGLLSSIYSQGTILVHLIKNFSLMSNLEADLELGQFREQPERVSPLRLALNLAGDFRPQAEEASKKIEVHINTFDELYGERSLVVVKNLVAQALSNLLENAIKYSQTGTTIDVEATTVQVKQTGETWHGVSVRSTGLPIRPDEVKTLCDRGFRGSAAKQRVPAGTGIGLHLANRVMILHQGMVHINAKGNDTRISLLFPNMRIVDAKEKNSPRR